MRDHESNKMTPGTIYGVGLGPGAQDLMSVRADRLIRQAQHVAYFHKAGRQGHARRIIEGMLADGVNEYPMTYPMTTEVPFSDPRYQQALADFYEEQVAQLKALAQAGESVVVLCEGDPFFYGSFMHLYTRLTATVPVEVVPGITGMSAAWTATGQPITWGDDILTVLVGTLPEATLTAQMQASDALVVMKIGQHLDKVRSALAQAGRMEQAWLIEYAAMGNQQVRPLIDAPDKAPYFSIVLVHGQGRRP